MTKAVLLTDPTRVNLNLDNAFVLEPMEADGLMFAGILFFCRHHTEMAIEAGTPVIAYHTVEVIDPDRLVDAILKARERRAAQTQNSPEPTTTFNMDAWGDMFANGKPETQN